MELGLRDEIIYCRESCHLHLSRGISNPSKRKGRGATVKGQTRKPFAILFLLSVPLSHPTIRNATLRTTMKLIMVTGNANKLKEVRSILAGGSIEIASQDLDLPEIQGTTQEVASAKVEAAAAVIGGPCITEVRSPRDPDASANEGADEPKKNLDLEKDTALAFTALGGLPGPYIKYFLKEVGHEGTV